MESVKIKVFHCSRDEYGNWYAKGEKGYEKFTDVGEMLQFLLAKNGMDLTDIRRLNQLKRLDGRGRITHLSLAIAPDLKLAETSICSVMDSYSRRLGFLQAVNGLADSVAFEKNYEGKLAFYYKGSLVFLGRDEIRADKPDASVLEMTKMGSLKGQLAALKLKRLAREDQVTAIFQKMESGLRRKIDQLIDERNRMKAISVRSGKEVPVE